MLLCDVREITEQIVNCKLKRDARIWIAFAYHRLEVNDLFDKFILHAVPHNLQKQALLYIYYNHLYL